MRRQLVRMRQQLVRKRQQLVPMRRRLVLVQRLVRVLVQRLLLSCRKQPEQQRQR